MWLIAPKGATLVNLTYSTKLNLFPICFCYLYLKNIKKSMAYSSHGSHTGQLDFCN